MPFLMVLVTREPSATAPTNSVQKAKTPTMGMLSVCAATEVAYELATSLAPLLKAAFETAISAVPYLFALAAQHLPPRRR